MGKKYTLQNKIVWRGKITENLATSFYPSFYKDIKKKESLFSENFKVVFKDATLDDLKDKLIPLYQSEIMDRENFNLDRSNIIDSIIQRVLKNPSKYKLLFISDNVGTLVGATLFSIVGDTLQMAFRAYRRDVRIKSLKHKASLDYWGEKLVREFGIRNRLTIFSHGRDTHPYIGRRRVGLALYKLKAGTRPKLSQLDNPEKPVETLEIDETFLLKKNEPVVFFDSPNNEGFYQSCSFYCPTGLVHESFINEFEVVCNWAGIVFNSVGY